MSYFATDLDHLAEPTKPSKLRSTPTRNIDKLGKGSTSGAEDNKASDTQEWLRDVKTSRLDIVSGDNILTCPMGPQSGLDIVSGDKILAFLSGYHNKSSPETTFKRACGPTRRVKSSSPETTFKRTSCQVVSEHLIQPCGPTGLLGYHNRPAGVPPQAPSC